MANMALSIKNLYQWFPKDGKKLKVLHDINFEIGKGHFLALVGASGCGKSTLLRAILGTVPQKAGSIKVNGQEVTGPNRNVGIVYQHYSLYDFLTAEQNVAVGLKWDQTNALYRTFRPFDWRKLRKRHLEEAREFLVKLKLEHALSHYPCDLSGGMRQRVAIAQALIMKPSVILLDEPFGALDEATREQLQTMLLTLYQEEDRPTVIIITHELNEALYVGDRLAGLSKNWWMNGTSPDNGPDCGATKMYDKATPIFHPDDPRDYESFSEMKHEIREVVLGEGNKGPVHPHANVTFWDESKADG